MVSSRLPEPTKKPGSSRDQSIVKSSSDQSGMLANLLTRIIIASDVKRAISNSIFGLTACRSLSNICLVDEYLLARNSFTRLSDHSYDERVRYQHRYIFSASKIGNAYCCILCTEAYGLVPEARFGINEEGTSA